LWRPFKKFKIVFYFGPNTGTGKRMPLKKPLKLGRKTAFKFFIQFCLPALSLISTSGTYIAMPTKIQHLFNIKEL
jgi:hypothetical protein